jgi:hypothetical protein
MRRRGFALIAALGTLAVLGLIVAALGDSVQAQRQLQRVWMARGSERLAIQWALNQVSADVESIDGAWGEVTVHAVAETVGPDHVVYDHPVLSHREGDRLVTVMIAGEVRHCLERVDSTATDRHVFVRLPAGLISTEEDGA